MDEQMLATIFASSDYLMRNGLHMPMQTERWITAAMKQRNYYERVLERLVRDLYEGRIGKYQFMQMFEDTITSEFNRAWLEGMEENGLNPEDMEQEWEYEVNQIVQQEHNYILAFALAIITAAAMGEVIDPFIKRVLLWGNRYDEVMGRSTILTAPDNKNFRWVLGATEKHCATCLSYSNKVAPASYWKRLQSSGIFPRSRKLDCRGYNCDCHLVQVQDRPNV